jgi:hypothetical protein
VLSLIGHLALRIKHNKTITASFSIPLMIFFIARHREKIVVHFKILLKCIPNCPWILV